MGSVVFVAPAEEYAARNTVIVHQTVEANEVFVQDCSHSLKPVVEPEPEAEPPVEE